MEETLPFTCSRAQNYSSVPPEPPQSSGCAHLSGWTKLRAFLSVSPAAAPKSLTGLRLAVDLLAFIFLPNAKKRLTNVSDHPPWLWCFIWEHGTRVPPPPARCSGRGCDTARGPQQEPDLPAANELPVCPCVCVCVRVTHFHLRHAAWKI